MTTRKERERQARYDLMWTEENEKRWLSSYSINEMQLAELKEVFMLLDKQGDCTMKVADVGLSLRAIGQNPSELQVQQLMKEVAVNENGFLTFDEYMRVVNGIGLREERDMIADLEEAFRVFDKQDDGSINVEEVIGFLQSLSEALPEEDIQQLSQLIGDSQNGKIKYCELVKKLTSK